MDESGNVLVVGSAPGTLAGGDSLQSVFVRKYDPSGTEQWTRAFRAGSYENGYGVAVDSGGNVFVGGSTNHGTFPGQSGANYTDAFVRKYDASGTEQWTRQFGTNGSDRVRGAAVDANGNVIVTGHWSGTILDFAGDESAFVRKYDTSGALLWTREFGTGDFDTGYDVSAAESGNVYIAGKTHGTLPGQSGPGGAFLRKYDSSGAEQWTRQFGTLRSDEARRVAVDGSESVYVAGSMGGQAFVRRYAASGNEQWTRQLAPSSGRSVGVAVDETGNVYLAGTTTGTLPGQTSAGDYDFFVRKYDGSGDEQWTRQLGTEAQDLCEAVVVEGSGVMYVVGSTRGTFPGQASAGLTDAFLMRIVP